MTQCSRQLHFKSIKKRQVLADFSGGNITGDAGLLLLREVDSLAYLLMHRLRKACKSTPFEHAEIQTIRLKLLKIGARVVESCRRIWFHFSSAYPYKKILEAIHAKLVTA